MGNRHLRYLEEAQHGVVNVYSRDGGGRAFTGYGVVSDEWFMVTPLRLPKGSASSQAPTLANGDGDTASISYLSADKPLTFSISELYDAIRSGMVALAAPGLQPHERIPYLSVRDRVFVSGTLPPNSPFLDQGRPRTTLSQYDMSVLEGAERGPVRHYQAVRMAAWDGEVEVTTFVHVALRGRTLYVEFVATLLPGIDPRFHKVDTYERLDASATIGAAARSFLDLGRAPFAVLRSPRLRMPVSDAHSPRGVMRTA